MEQDLVTSITCPKCHHTWEEEVLVPDWYETLVACEGARRSVPPLEYCEAWLDDHEGSWGLVDEKSAVVENYWDSKKKASPWAMFRTFVLRELREREERVERIAAAKKTTTTNY